MGQEQTGPIYHDEVNIMLTTSERQRLCSTMANEPARTLGAVLKCGICIAMVTLLILIGSSGEQEDAAKSASVQALHQQWAARASSAAAHRKEVLEARRTRFAGSDSAQAAAE